MKKEVRLYNVLFPIWLLWIFPQVWLVVAPANLAVDCLVLTLTLTALGHRGKRGVVRQLWWKFWLLGFLADFVGVALLLPSMFVPELLDGEARAWAYENLSPLWHNVFRSPAAFLWMLLAVAAAGACIYFFDRRAMGSCRLLTGREKHIVALTMAIVTAPWLFFIPMY